MIPQFNADAVYDLRSDGAVFVDKESNYLLHPASVMKVLTIFTARKWVTDEMLGDLVEVLSSDRVGGSSARLEAGDILTWNDLFHGLMLPSGNDAAHTIARTVGGMILSTEGKAGNPLERFLTQMRTEASNIGWHGTTIASPSGWPDSTSRFTVRQAAELAFHLDDYSVQVMGTLSYDMAVTGPNARTYRLYNTTNPNGATKLLGFVGAKTGTIPFSEYLLANLLLIWDDNKGLRHVTVVFHAWPQPERFIDARAVQDYVNSGAKPLGYISAPPLPHVSIGKPLAYRYRLQGVNHDVKLRLRVDGRTVDVLT